MPAQPPPPLDQPAASPKEKKLLDQLRDAIRARHYSYRTEQTYLDWCKRYILYHHKRHPAGMGVPEIQAFITHLATERNVAASTHTVLAFGAREIRRSAPRSASSFTATSCSKRSNFPPTYFAPKSRTVSPQSSPKPKPSPSFNA